MPADQNKTLGGIKIHSHCNTNLIGLEGISIKKIQSSDTYRKIFIETKPSEQICPTCGAVTKGLMIIVIRLSKIYPCNLLIASWFYVNADMFVLAERNFMSITTFCLDIFIAPLG